MKTKFSMRWRKMGAFALAVGMSLSMAYAQTVPMSAGTGVKVTQDEVSTTITYNEKYQTATYKVKQSNVTEVSLNITADSQFCIKLCDASGEAFETDYPCYGVEESTTDDYVYTIPSTEELGQIQIMSISDGQILTVNNLEVKTSGAATTSNIVKVPTSSVKDGHGVTVTKADDKAVIDYEEKYQTATCPITSENVKEVTLDITADYQFCIKLCDATGEPFKTDYPGYGLEETTTDSYTFTVDETEKLAEIQIMSLTDGQTVTVNDISLKLRNTEARPTGLVKGVEKDANGYYSLAGLMNYYGMKFGTNVTDTNIYNSNNTAINNFHCNSITASNEMKAYSLLDQYASKNSPDGMPRMNYTAGDKIMAYAAENNLGVRAHTLVWDAYMTDWFFREGYDSNKPYVSQEVAKQRLKSYIEQVVTHFESKYPGVIYCWDVVNEGVEPSSKLDANDPRGVEDNIWSQRVGSDYIELSFKYAKDAIDKCALENGGKTNIKLFYNDFSTFYPEKRDAICNLVKSLNSYEKDSNGEYIKLCDGVGMQGYIGGYGKQDGCMNTGDITLIKNAIKKFHSLGVEVQVTEMAVRNYDNSPETIEKHAKFYKALFDMFIGLNEGEDKPLTGISIWGLYDNPSMPTSDYSWSMNSPYCGLFDENFKPKEALKLVEEALVENLPASAFDEDKKDEDKKDDDKQQETTSPLSIVINSDWGQGAVANVTITNNTGKDLDGWNCTFTTNRPITQVWSANLISNGENTYTISNPEWQPNLKAGESYTFGCMLGSGDASVNAVNVTLK
ncbi:endo-1,4-beta-xylanase [Cellulosilyticum ruminicola]